MLNKTDLAAPLGLSVPALTEWINILEMTGQIIVVPPFYENFGKRVIKSPQDLLFRFRAILLPFGDRNGGGLAQVDFFWTNL